MYHRLTLKSPLFVDWTEQYVRLKLPWVESGASLELTVDGIPWPFQFTGSNQEGQAQILVKIGLSRGQERHLVFTESAVSGTDLGGESVPLLGPTAIGVSGREIVVSPEAPFASAAGFPMQSRIVCDKPLIDARLTRGSDGPLFTDYHVKYRFEDDRSYELRFRCYKADPLIEVEEHFRLQKGGRLVWTLNPGKLFTHILSRDSFEGESQPTMEPLGLAHPADVLCRLQMPVLTEYFIPNNRGWFALCNEENEERGMLGILGLYGAKWQQPVESMPEILDREGMVEWNASLESGVRHWMFYLGPVERDFTPDRRFVFHRLHAEFNALRLDEHLDLTGEANFDQSAATEPGFFEAGDYHASAQERQARFPELAEALRSPNAWMRGNGRLHTVTYRYLIDPSCDLAQEAYDLLLERFELWVRQFQGWRTGVSDYLKNVIGFSRHLRGMLLTYEMLRRDGVLSAEQTGKLNAYFAFAARRILDEGRWPHSRTMLHPDHPESSRDFYTYGGEHKPDRLHWTNSLPNFQGDPMCALAHLSAIFVDHPDVLQWRQRALDDLERQLNAYCGTSGAWEESINYALYTLSYFVITFRTLKARCGLDYFNDDRARRFVAWLCRFLGPEDKRWERFTFPGVGNATCPTGGGEALLCYAAGLPEDDPLRRECLAVWQRLAPNFNGQEHYLTVLAAMAPEVPAEWLTLTVLESERMDEVGIALRHRHTLPEESYLVQKIGFAKDHYESDESAFNWYAKGTPFCMDYGTYTGDVGVACAHNLVEIPDADALRRGYIAADLFTGMLDYTHCEIPVTLKLMWDHVRSFAEVDGTDGVVAREKTPYFYIGDKNPVGPKCWKVRKLLFVKPDYLVIFDRVYGEVPHRYNLHFTGTDLTRDGQTITGKGRFDLDLLAYVQHPSDFRLETGETIPNFHPADYGPDENLKHGQHHFRVYNETDGIYRTVLFAGERGRAVQIESAGEFGIRVVTPEYTDYVFIHNEPIDFTTSTAAFFGRAGWIRQWADGRVQACVPDGEMIRAFGVCIRGRGPWTYGLSSSEEVGVLGSTPRTVSVTRE